MTKSQTVKMFVGMLVVGIAVALAVRIFVRHHSDFFFATGAPTTEPTTAPAAEDETVATVTTAPITTGEISQTITAYGNVTAQPGVVTVYSVPFESRVRHLRVSSGESVNNAAPLIEIEPSPDAKLQFLEAQQAVESAKNDAASARQRFDLKLATQSELQLANQSLQTATVKLEAVQQRGAGDASRIINADTIGVISKVDVQQGQLVPAGGPLLEIVPQGQIEIRMGVEPANVSQLKAEQAVKLFPGFGPADGLPGTIRLVTQRVNPDTRLVDVFVTPGDKSTLLLDGFVRAEVVSKTDKAMIVPREAVLPGDQGFTLFTVKDSKAVKHTVTLGAQNDKEVAIVGEGLTAGDQVVIAGNLELDDGTAVTTAANEKADKPESAATSPTTAAVTTEPAATTTAPAPTTAAGEDRK